MQHDTDNPEATMTNAALIAAAHALVQPRTISHGCTVGDVGCALLSARNKLYVGVCIDTACGMGFCAEHSAIAAMITHGEQRIKKIVAVVADGSVLPPCGRCREFIRQIDPCNMDETEVVLGTDRSVKLRELLPLAWD